MTLLCAQPLDSSAKSFHFQTIDEFKAKFKTNLTEYDEPALDYEISFVEGEEIDRQLAKAWRLNQFNFEAFLNALTNWSFTYKVQYIIAIHEYGATHEYFTDIPNNIKIEIISAKSIHVGDLSCKHRQFTILDTLYTYRCINLQSGTANFNEQLNEEQADE